MISLKVRCKTSGGFGLFHCKSTQ